MTICKKRLLPTFFIFIISYSPLLAQSNLLKEVTIGAHKQERIANLLAIISNKQSFSFAYNNKVIPADSLVSVSGYSGTVMGLLEKILGEHYEFKEVPGYIVLRYAPRKLSITAEADKDQGTQTILKGFVRDVANQRPVAQASVYEKDLLLSTLTDDRGYFEMKLKNHSGSIILTAIKEDYRDTSVNLLTEVVVNFKSPAKKYKYYPDNAGGSDLEHSRFARLFISSKQLLQGLNVGNFFASSPYQISLVPRLSTQGFYNSQVIDHVSVNLMGGYTAGIDGVELGCLFNINRKDMHFMQIAGIFNFVGGSVKGVQLAGLYNRVLNNATGVQFAGLANRTNRFTAGLQLAPLANIDKQTAGVQLAGLVNTAVSGKGLAIAGLTNIARDSSGVQVAGLVNKSGYVSLLQAGTLNIAKKAHGIQIGLINVADTSDYAIGLINFIKNGEKSISLSTDESFFTHADFRSGGRVLYGLIGLGFQQGTEKMQFAFNIGIGAHVINYKKFSLNTEYVTSFFRDIGDKQYQILSLSFFPGYKLNKHWTLFAGPAVKLASADKGYALENNGWIWSRSSTNTHVNTLFSGMTSGMMYRW